MKTIQFDETKYKLVPLEPTGEMIKCGEMWDDGFAGAWHRAVHAAPAAEEAPGQVSLPEAMQVVLDAMRTDPDYAWSWHCNVAMGFVDAGGDTYTANQGAARFMRILANVEPAHPLPQQPATHGEPVAWMCSDDDLLCMGYSKFSKDCSGAWNIPVYTAPQPAPAHIKAMQQALEALEISPYMSNKDDHDFHQQTITVLQNALPKE